MSRFNSTAIRKYLDISTSHITKEDNEILESGNVSFVVYEYEYGFWVHVAEESIQDEMPASCMSAGFLQILREAEAEGICWIKIDRDGDTHDSLTLYDW